MSNKTDDARTISLGFTEERFPAGIHVCQIFQDDAERQDSLLRFLLAVILLAGPALGASSPEGKLIKPAAPAFWIGKPDGTALEFGGAKAGWQAYAQRFPKDVVFSVGQDQASAWPFIHPSTHDSWAGSKAHTFTIRFTAGDPPKKPSPLYLVLGLVSSHASPSLLAVSVNGTNIATRRLAPGGGSGEPAEWGKQAALTIP
ncbi:MAG: polysaccharide lyase family protein, partial [Verrucomicrobia bacterium]|nr:polysaccharide lyase family protein [Verrucomicrobiota bacterium]